eukprot:3577642-Pleurochrysis_carterae.AAC.2
MPAPERAQANSSTTSLALMTMLVALAAFAVGRSHTLEGFDMLQILVSGIEAMTQHNGLSACADDMRRFVREYPLSTYLVLGRTVLVPSQPTFHARVKNAYCAMRNALWCAAADDGRDNPRGCDTRRLFCLLAQRVASAGGPHRHHESMPPMAAAGTKSLWFGDTGAAMAYVTRASMAVAGSLRPNLTVIVNAIGTATPKCRCDVDLPLRRDKGCVVQLRLTDVLVLTQQRISQPHQTRAPSQGSPRGFASTGDVQTSVAFAARRQHHSSIQRRSPRGARASSHGHGIPRRREAWQSRSHGRSTNVGGAPARAIQP